MSIGYSETEEWWFRDELAREDARKRQRDAHRRHADPLCGCPICEPTEDPTAEDEESEEDEGDA